MTRQLQPNGRIIRVGAGEAQYEAFMPHPLPPKIEFTAELASALSDADRALGQLAGLGLSIPNPRLLIKPFVAREAVLSSRIEGTRAGVAELYAFEAESDGKQGQAEQSDVREVANYVRALEYGLERLSTLPLSLRLIREIHEKLMEGVRGDTATPGEFRRSQNWIGRPGSNLNTATFVPPPVAEMHAALSALEDYLHSPDDTPPLIRIAAIHYQFESIHPFLDGNGRVGRLLISLLLSHWNILQLPLLYLSAYFERNRPLYYEKLLAVSRESAWLDWLTFFARGVAEESLDAARRAAGLQDLQSEYRDKILELRGSPVALRLVDQLFDTPVITVPQAQRALCVAYNSAKLAIAKLVAAGILCPSGNEVYGRAFVAKRILDTIQ